MNRRFSLSNGLYVLSVCVCVCVLTHTSRALDDVRNLRTFGTAVKGMTINDTHEFTLWDYEIPSDVSEFVNGGIVKQTWYTGKLIWPSFGQTLIRVYIDGEVDPSLEYTIDMAVGIGFDKATLAPWGFDEIGSVAFQGGKYLNIPVPFTKSVRYTALMGHELGVFGESAALYFIGRGVLNGTLQIGDMLLPPDTRLRLRTLVDEDVAPQHFVTFANNTDTRTLGKQSANLPSPVWSMPEYYTYGQPGGGLLYMVTMQGQSSNLKYLEGSVYALIDGETVRLSSGTEDYFLSAQYFDLGDFHTPVSGCTHMDRFIGHSFSAYRFHIRDPVVWQKQFGLVWECGDGAHKTDTYNTTLSAYVWTYEWPL